MIDIKGFIFLSFTLRTVLTSVASTDLCLPGNHQLLRKRPGQRGSKCVIPRSRPPICDRYLHNDWYKVQHEDDPVARKMIDTPVHMFLCGTSYPIWLNGTHPGVSEGIANRTACVSGRNSYCDHEYNIQIKNCSTFFIYKLEIPEFCDSGYCFGKDKACSRPNPCEKDFHIQMDISADRSSSCKIKGMSLCDNLLRDEWYRVKRNNKDISIATSCPSTGSCGTQHPIWLKDRTPLVSEKIVNRKACVNKDDSCNCNKFYNIEIRNCSSFLVFNLTSSDECPERYCFGETEQCSFGGEEKQDNDKYIYGGIAGGMLLVAVIVAGVIIMTKKKNPSDKPKMKGQDMRGDNVIFPK